MEDGGGEKETIHLAWDGKVPSKKKMGLDRLRGQKGDNKENSATHCWGENVRRFPEGQIRKKGGD